MIAPGADLRYRVYRNGTLREERTDITDLWREDFVAFLLGCSFSFEHQLLDAGQPVRNVEQQINGPVFRSNRDCVPAGKFHRKLVVSMRPMPPHLVAEAAAITHAHPEVHGGPVHIGSPQALGITDLDEPDWGSPVRMEPDDVPMFWACGVTPQQAARFGAGSNGLITRGARGSGNAHRATESLNVSARFVVVTRDVSNAEDPVVPLPYRLPCGASPSGLAGAPRGAPVRSLHSSS
ncbi:D-glutamate cyclase family protein [Mycolicibacterium sp.]|uniref:D-glutamate cyclase family protein n=1 Tax=Mycolicibacterium sp. TaxID=2320850 RepID=UPI003D0B5F2C